MILNKSLLFNTGFISSSSISILLQNRSDRTRKKKKNNPKLHFGKYPSYSILNESIRINIIETAQLFLTALPSTGHYIALARWSALLVFLTGKLPFHLHNRYYGCGGRMKKIQGMNEWVTSWCRRQDELAGGLRTRSHNNLQFHFH